MKIATYTVNVICDNCHWKGGVAITRGQPVAQKACPTCGCSRLRLVDRLLGRWSPW